MSRRPAIGGRRGRVVAGGLIAGLAITGAAVALAGGSPTRLHAPGVAWVVPRDALAVVRISLDRDSPAIRRGLAVGGRLPGVTSGGAVVLGRLGQVLAGGGAVDFGAQVSRWARGRALLALLNTPTSTAAPLIAVDVSDRRAARSFLRGHGAVARGSYRGTPLQAYPDGDVLAFVGSELVVGRPAAVRRAIDVAAGAVPPLGAAAPYRRSTSGEPPDTVVSAYASAAGVRRILAGQGGLLGALGGLLSRPGLQGVAMSLQPTARGARVRIRSALRPGAPDAARPVDPSLARVIPADADLMVELTGLDRALPRVLGAGSAAGLGGGLGPLLGRLGSALAGAGVDVHALVSLFAGRSVVAILGSGRSVTMVVAAAVPDQDRAEAELGQVGRALSRLVAVSPGRSGAGSVYRTQRVDGIAVHAFQLTPTLALDYAALHGLVMVATSPEGVAALARPSHPLGADPSFQAALSGRPASVTSLGYADMRRLLRALAPALGSTATGARLLPDLRRIGTVGLTSTGGPGESTTDLTIQVHDR